MGGTPAYMPREQVLDYKYAKPQVDVWAATACLYYMLTGTSPRTFPPDRDWWEVILETLPVRIRERDAGRDLPPALAEFIDNALNDIAVVPYAAAAELRKHLNRVMVADHPS